MLPYILRRLLQGIPVLLGVSLGVFLMLQFAPGDPATVLAGENASPDAIARIRHDLGLDQPLPVQYLRFIERLLHGDLGTSTRTHRSVWLEIGDRFPYTLELTLTALILSTAIGLGLGVFAAMHQGRAGDWAVMGVAVAGLSVPTFWIALVMILFLALHGHWLPVAGAETWRHLVMPALALCIHPAAVNARIVRATMLETLGQDYVRVARAKGLRERTVMGRHALRNALLPITTLVGLQLGGLLGGDFIIETLFGWPGIGRLAVQSILNRDFPVIQGTVLLVAVTYVICNLAVDVLYAGLDPRIRQDN